ncbi:hypothetical protein PHMEG_00034540, partial [Phytophthora megakarya]
MIASGNALPPPAYGVMCDINVGDHAPIKQRTRRIPIRYLQKLYELLKGQRILGHNDDSQSSQDIGICLSTGALRMAQNAIRGGWRSFAEKMKAAEDLVKSKQAHSAEHSTKPWGESPIAKTKFAAARNDVENQDPVLMLVNEPASDMFATNEVDESALVPVFDRRSFVDDICFGGKTFDDCLTTLDRLLARFTECRIGISFTKSIFVQPRVEFLSHEVSHEGIRANTKKLAAITKLSFPRTKRGMQSFLGALNYYSRFIQDFAVFGAALYQLKDDDFEEDGDLTTARRSFDMLKQKVAEAPILRHFDKTKEVHIMLFANEWALSTTLLQLHEDKLHP